MAEIDRLLRLIIEAGASDLHLTGSVPPYYRVDGDMTVIPSCDVLTPAAIADLMLEIMPAENREQFRDAHDTDFAYEIADLARFRVNVFEDRNGIGSVMRQIPSKVPTADQLNLPQAVRELCNLTKGLVVVTGPTGSGKSTTLAAMIDLINKTRAEHIITIEDPIEFVHPPQRCLINQREVHKHTKSFSSALRAALREDPDIVLVGELRDLETMEIAIETAETGHLVFGTLHTNTAVSTVDRIVDKFPPSRQSQIRSMLASSLRGVIAQTLCKKRGGGRVAAMEILIVTTGVASNIREGKTHHIPSAMQTGRRIGMQSLDDALLKLAMDGAITGADAYARAMDKASFEKKLENANVTREPTPGEDLFVAPQPGEEGHKMQEDKQRMAEWSARLEQDPNNWEALNNLAWFMATNPCDELRNGAQAVVYAERAGRVAGKQGDEISVLDTLAAAYAENGQFDKALAAVKRALKLATKEGRQSSLQLLQRAQVKYQAGEPSRDT